ncbi:hypothetical protein Lsan_3251 [Legionella santicrucis]|uniref:RavJ-like C-terminal domain-containing protein n=1 Tax=Legionella santicrucis TaxID=45074 RepID=A0A0W0YGR3_9GAMM|nr:DUF5617 domain-containing protein [Legionella santicrucis]KTD55699.1 hypothetical protein Lsan_3251 [Legionella santicrucis]
MQSKNIITDKRPALKLDEFLESYNKHHKFKLVKDDFKGLDPEIVMIEMIKGSNIAFLREIMPLLIVESVNDSNLTTRRDQYISQHEENLNFTGKNELEEIKQSLERLKNSSPEGLEEAKKIKEELTHQHQKKEGEIQSVKKELEKIEQEFIELQFPPSEKELKEADTILANLDREVQEHLKNVLQEIHQEGLTNQLIGLDEKDFANNNAKDIFLSVRQHLFELSNNIREKLNKHDLSEEEKKELMSKLNSLEKVFPTINETIKYIENKSKDREYLTNIVNYLKLKNGNELLLGLYQADLSEIEKKLTNNNNLVKQIENKFENQKSDLKSEIENIEVKNKYIDNYNNEQKNAVRKLLKIETFLSSSPITYTSGTKISELTENIQQIAQSLKDKEIERNDNKKELNKLRLEKDNTINKDLQEYKNDRLTLDNTERNNLIQARKSTVTNASERIYGKKISEREVKIEKLGEKIEGLEGKLDKAQRELMKAILLDYTKNNSVFQRILSGAWNRHHIKAAEDLINKIDKLESSQLKQEINKLDNQVNNSKHKTGAFKQKLNEIKALYNVDKQPELEHDESRGLRIQN